MFSFTITKITHYTRLWSYIGKHLDNDDHRILIETTDYGITLHATSTHRTITATIRAEVQDPCEPFVVTYNVYQAILAGMGPGVKEIIHTQEAPGSLRVITKGKKSTDTTFYTEAGYQRLESAQFNAPVTFSAKEFNATATGLKKLSKVARVAISGDKVKICAVPGLKDPPQLATSVHEFTCHCEACRHGATCAVDSSVTDISTKALAELSTAYSFSGDVELCMNHEKMALSFEIQGSLGHLVIISNHDTIPTS